MSEKNAIEVSSQQKIEIRLMSDGKLYEEAIAFVDKNPAVENKQMMGLLKFSQSWTDLERFVKHQADRDWGEPGRNSRAHYNNFYQAMILYMNELYQFAKKQFVPDGLTRAQTSEQTRFFAGLLAREFIQHVTSEMLIQESGAMGETGGNR